ncbi:tRNA (N6-threonylcarbamoyladenosine(37)-N6)-methyltransferase TrmO [Salinarchaeum sp. IM2453]|uniref:tRNA (N6-threonylcarbamoyladenosine(37)-N6)-methyltransferase TrmO n=1 Tax=Salinarchaeum sp. IM2453 TaxID=2862870 RepID=UPI001C83F2E3|nr:tRNA (N6-threonylcarbamoyladenosine(37)-N6)-methyltransferase TrmO [Salinarchaeum sp. IM2453]QZA88047.1 tRNA (N6-threonylcarbamoyladenosine(37)-N6)-methyltransferase TrmO [Salinarchaeum sp. IM2453]
MNNDTIAYKRIGTIHTPFQTPEDMPIQPVGNETASGEVRLDNEYTQGVTALSGFTHCILLYHFHQASTNTELSVTPFLDSTSKGVFATRAPQRPNRIGMSVVKIEEIVGSTIQVTNIDVLDETPLLDIKPYVPDFDCPSSVTAGWLEEKGRQAETTQSDERFTEPE